MSKFSKSGVRCDWCGKIANNENGEYVKPDGSAGYILQPEWERFPGGDPTATSVQSSNDICEECGTDQCPFCGSSEIVKRTPVCPGPTGWGSWCKSCKSEWAMPQRSEEIQRCQENSV